MISFDTNTQFHISSACVYRSRGMGGISIDRYTNAKQLKEGRD